MNIKINIQNFGSFDLFDFDSWYPKISKKLSNIEILDIVLIGLKQQYSNKNKTLKEEEKDKIGIIIKDIQNIKGYFEVSDKLNLSDKNDLVVEFFRYLKEKDFYNPYLEAWITMIEAEQWSDSKLYNKYLRSLEHKDWSYAYKYAQIILAKGIKNFTSSQNSLSELLVLIKTNILQKNESIIKTEFDKITKIFKETLKPEYMIIPKTIKPEPKVACSILILDIISFSDTEINSEQQMLTKFNNMITYFRNRINETLLNEKNITPDDMTVLYVGDCLAIALKSQNHQEILFEFARDIFEQTDNNKYTCALHTGNAYWISFENYEDSPFKQLIHPTINDAFRLSSMGKSKEYIYITESYYNAIKTNNKFSDYAHRIEKTAIDKKNGEAIEILEQDNNGIFYQTIKTNKVKYIKFKRR